MVKKINLLVGVRIHVRRLMSGDKNQCLITGRGNRGLFNLWDKVLVKFE